MAEMMDLYNEAENSVLGTLIADAEVNASLVFTRVRPEDFVTGISRQIFETCRAMYGRGDVIDPLTVKAACGSEFATWLKELEQITPSARYCGAYVDKLLELSAGIGCKSCSARRWTATLPGCRWKNSSARSSA